MNILIHNNHSTGQFNVSMQFLQNWFGGITIALGHPVYGDKKTVENLITFQQVRNYQITLHSLSHGKML